MLRPPFLVQIPNHAAESCSGFDGSAFLLISMTGFPALSWFIGDRGTDGPPTDRPRTERPVALLSGMLASYF